MVEFYLVLLEWNRGRGGGGGDEFEVDRGFYPTLGEENINQNQL